MKKFSANKRVRNLILRLEKVWIYDKRSVAEIGTIFEDGNPICTD